MNNITVNIKNIVSENLNEIREKKLNESYDFSDVKTKEELIHRYVETSIKLINEGFSLDDIKSKLSDANVTVKDKTNLDFSDAFVSSLYSTGKEFAIKWLLDYIGFNPTLSRMLAQGLADVSIRDIILPWKNLQTCEKHMPNLLDAVLEVWVRNEGSKILRYDKTKERDAEELRRQRDSKIKRSVDKSEPKYVAKLSSNKYDWSDIPEIGLGNVFGELIRQSPTSEFLSKHLCKFMHNEK